MLSSPPCSTRSLLFESMLLALRLVSSRSRGYRTCREHPTFLDVSYNQLGVPISVNCPSPVGQPVPGGTYPCHPLPRTDQREYLTLVDPYLHNPGVAIGYAGASRFLQPSFQRVD
ncbi:hypothetical protein SCHPADRAFT_616994 [Schizopora paradoxa]|uniref:Uncharacterized protein n=1 Tax=Schizopora paradoxa TaxID=27342 RepID=A0A0H2R8P2_9AGAM|nr:hypothetical protein SCHPADRAFT_616994 [Schizopora paradoxa]